MSAGSSEHRVDKHSIEESDRLRSPNQLCTPDARSHYLVHLDDHTGAPRPITAVDQHAAIACYKMNPEVPTSVAVHFETAKNLYLYGWFVFRFYPVAEQQALASLEFALREKLADFVNACKEKNPKAPIPSLRKLLKTAIESGLLRNDAFLGRDQWALERAKDRFRLQKMREMIAAGLEEMVLDDSGVHPTEEDLHHDWLGSFVEAIPAIRNDYAHGSKTLHHSVLHTFDFVSQMINQLFPKTQNE